MRWIRGVGFISALVAASFLLAYAHPFGDAGLYGAKAAQAPIPEDGTLPSDARTILVAKCADCDSTQTHTPIYGHSTPISWLVERGDHQPTWVDLKCIAGVCRQRPTQSTSSGVHLSN